MVLSFKVLKNSKKIRRKKPFYGSAQNNTLLGQARQLQPVQLSLIFKQNKGLFES